jgi:hypothetical protein
MPLKNKTSHISSSPPRPIPFAIDNRFILMPIFEMEDDVFMSYSSSKTRQPRGLHD